MPFRRNRQLSYIGGSQREPEEDYHRHPEGERGRFGFHPAVGLPHRKSPSVTTERKTTTGFLRKSTLNHFHRKASTWATSAESTIVSASGFPRKSTSTHPAWKRTLRFPACSLPPSVLPRKPHCICLRVLDGFHLKYSSVSKSTCTASPILLVW